MASEQQAARGRTAAGWTSEADLRAQVERLWARGLLGQSLIRSARSSWPDLAADGEHETGAAAPLAFPLRLKLRRPTSSALSDRFDDVRSWIAALGRSPHVRIVNRQINHRVLGVNLVPAEAWVDSLDDALALINRTADGAALAEMADVAVHRRPSLMAWLERRPLMALANRDSWSRLLDFIDWLEANPEPHCYLRQVDVTGIDSKFIEDHRSVLIQLLDEAVPAAIADAEAKGLKGFESRYGFRTKPNLVRFRILDRSARLAGLPTPGAGAAVADISLDAATFAHLEVGVGTVFIVENEITFLAFPEAADAMVIFGSGFGTERLAEASWLGKRRVRYWGDIDTHGFAILDELRRRFLTVESFLMDRHTLDAHTGFWDTEPKQETRELPRLTPSEAIVYDDLRSNRLGPGVRLEQERVGYGHLRRALAI